MALGGGGGCGVVRDRGGRRAGTDEASRGLSPDQQADVADEDGRPGAGRAGQDVEARLELELEMVDDRQMADGEESQHGSLYR